MGKVTWTKEQENYLTELYTQGLPVVDIVQKINQFSGIERKYNAITSKAQKMGLSTLVIKPNNPKFKAIYQDYDWCYQKFVEDGLNHQEMAKEAMCTKRVIEKWCQEKHHIDTYTRMHNKNLNEIQHDLIIGSLLGDGHIDKRKDYPLFIVSHAENQKDYLFYKYELLKNLCEMSPTYYSRKEEMIMGSLCKCQATWRFNTRTYDCLKPYREMSKTNLMSQLNEYSFAIWMLDDRYCSVKGYWQLCSPLNTNKEREFMKNILWQKFGILAHEKTDNRYFNFYAEDSRKITNMILNHIPNSLDIIHYKILNKNKYQNITEVSDNVQ